MYGAKGKNGVIFITKKPVQSNMVTMTKRQAIDSNQISFTDKNNNSSVKPFISKSTETDSIPDKVFTKVENEAEFPGGHEAWIKYIVSKIKASIDSFTEKDYGTCILKFIVNTDGSISNVEATTMEGTELAKVSVDAINSGT